MVFKRVGIDSGEVESGYFDVSELTLSAVQNFKSVHHVFKVSRDKVKLTNGLDGIWEL